MKKIFSWIKTNLLGLEPPKKGHLKSKRRRVKKAAARPVKKQKPAAVRAAKPGRNGKAFEKQAPAAKTQEKKVGFITHFFTNAGAAIVKVSAGGIEIGDELHFKGHTTDFKIKVKSMQMNRLPILVAEKGHEIGIQVPQKVRDGDEVYKIIKR